MTDVDNYRTRPKSMQESFAVFSQEISSGSKIPVKLTFNERISNAKEGAYAGAQVGKAMGEGVSMASPLIGIIVGGVASLFGGIVGGIRGFFKKGT